MKPRKSKTKKEVKAELDKLCPENKPAALSAEAAPPVKKVIGRPFQPGQSGNPGGKPKKMISILSDALRERLKDIDPETQRTYAEKLANILVDEACKGKIPVLAIREIADRTEGKPKQVVDMNVNDPFAGRTDDEIRFFAENGFWPMQIEGAQA